MPEPGYRIPMQWMKSCVIIRSMFNGSVTVAPSLSLTQKQRAEPLFDAPSEIFRV
jgi:hypothetical protein